MKDKRCILLIILVLLLALLSFISIYINHYPFPNTDFNQIKLFSEKIVQGSPPVYSNSLNNLSTYPIFGIRGLMGFGGTDLYSTLVPGVIFVYSLFYGIYPALINFISILFGILSLLVFYIICRAYILKNKSQSILATTILGFSGPFIYASALPFKDIIALFYLLLATYFSFRYYEQKEIKSSILFSIFLSISVILNYSFAIFSLPLISLFLYTNSKTKGAIKRLLLISLIVFLIIFPIIFYQINYNGGFLKFNSPSFRLNQWSLGGDSGGLFSSLLKFDPGLLFSNLKNQLLFVAPITIILGVIFLFKKISFSKKNLFLFILLAITILEILFFYPTIWSGSNYIGSSGTSYARYTLFLWSTVAILLCLYLTYLMPKKLISLFIFFILIFGIFNAFYSQESLSSLAYTAKWSDSLKQTISNQTPINSIIFVSGLYDKYIYPVRLTAFPSALPPDIRLNESARIIRELAKKNYTVYFVNEKVSNEIDLPFDTYKDYYVKNGFSVINAFDNFYKIIPLNITNISQFPKNQ